MITTTLGHIAAAQAALERLGARALPVKAAYSTAKFLKLVREELTSYQTLHDDLVKKYGVESDPGSGNYRVLPDQWTVFRNDLAVVLETPVELAWNPIALDTLGDEPFRADDLIALGPFIVETTPAPTGAPALPR
jgi:hypothetical protein